MSTERKARNKQHLLTTFYGGEKRGKCIQVTPRENGSYITLDKLEASCLIKDLQDFLDDCLEEST